MTVTWRDWLTAGHAACLGLILVVLADEIVAPSIIRQTVEAIGAFIALLGLVLG